MTPENLYGALLPLFRDLLAENWESITIGGKKIDEKYGTTLTTLLTHNCGYIPPDFKLGQHIVSLGMEPSHVLTTQGFGLLTWEKQIADVKPFFGGRIVFPYFQDGKPIYWSGRETDATPFNEYFQGAKYLHQKTAEGFNRPLYLEPEDETYLVEGHFHALILRQHGLAGVAIGSARPSPSQIARLAQCHRIYWIPDVDCFTPTEDKMIGKDGAKKFQRGKTAEERLAEMLPTMRDLPRCRIVQYPAEFQADNKKGDLNDYFLKHTIENFIELLRDTLTADDIEVQSISRNLTPQEKALRLEVFASEIANRTPVEYNHLINAVSKHLSLNKDEQKHLRSRVSELRKDGIEDTKNAVAGSLYRKLYPGVDFVDGKLYYTVSRRTPVTKFEKGTKIETVEETPWIISSTREWFPATDTELAQRRLYFARGTNASMAEPLWTDDPSIKWGIPDFVEKGMTPDTGEIYADLRAYFKDHLYLTQEEYYDVITLFVMLSYCVHIFNSAPILGLNGTRGAGKTRALDLLDTTGFDTKMAATATAPVLFRFVEARGGMVLLDEQENLVSIQKTRDQVDEKILLLNAGYKKGATAGRIIGQENWPHFFRAYTTYVVANQKGFYPTLASRMIILPMVRPPKSVTIAHWDRIISEPRSTDLQNRLRCWTLAHAGAIAHAHTRFTTDLIPLLDAVGLRHREREVWIALFSLALAVDTLCQRPYEWQAEPGQRPEYPRQGHHLLFNLLEAQVSMTKHKNELMNADDQIPMLLAALREIVLAGRGGESGSIVPRYETTDQRVSPANRSEWYQSKELTKDLNKRQGLEFFPKEQGQNSLPFILKKAEVVNPETDIMSKMSFGSTRTTGIRLTEKAIQAACDRFDVPESLQVEYMDKKNSDREQGSF